MKSSLYILFIATLALSCSKDNITAQGNLISKSRSYKGYETVRVDNGINLIVQNTGGDTITIATSENIEPYVLTSLKNDSLSISLQKNLNVSGDYCVDVYVEVDDIEKIYALNGAEVFVTAPVSQDIDVYLSNNSRFRADVKCDKLGVTLASASQATLSGTCNFLTVNGTSSSQFNGTNFVTQTLNCTLSNSAYLTTSVTKSLSVDVSSKAILKYRGNGVMDAISVQTNGKVEKLEE